MPMTVIVLRGVEPRYHGFLASVMLEIAPGVFTAPNLAKPVRLRIWAVLEDWYGTLRQGSALMTWRDPAEPCGQGLTSLGEQPRRFAEVDGIVLVRRDTATVASPP
jgi:CRISPR-associated protein Cas2